MLACYRVIRHRPEIGILADLGSPWSFLLDATLHWSVVPKPARPFAIRGPAYMDLVKDTNQASQARAATVGTIMRCCKSASQLASAHNLLQLTKSCKGSFLLVDVVVASNGTTPSYLMRPPTLHHIVCSVDWSTHVRTRQYVGTGTTMTN